MDYGRSVVIDVPAVQSQAAQKHPANPVRRWAGLRGGGGNAEEGAGREVSWRIRLCPSEEGRERSDPGTLSTLYRLLITKNTKYYNMEMKKRISLELRNRTPAEVSRFLLF